MNLGSAIRKIRTDKKVAQGVLADQCGISQAALSQIENGIKRPNPKTLKSLSKALNVPEPIFYIYGMEISDVPASKKSVYDLLYPTVEDMIKRILIDEEKK